MNQTTLGDHAEWKEFILETQRDIREMCKQMDCMIIVKSDHLDDIPHIKVAIKDIKDELSIIKNCLMNKGLLEDNVL